MGMVGLQRSAYLFLAVTMAPAVSSLANVPIIAVHLFIIFYAGLGGLTPPVAINAFIAAGIARADGRRTAWTSLRLGAVLFFIPIFFVLQPALIMHGSPIDIVYHTALAALGIFLLTSGLEGYILVLGILNLLSRVGLMIAGLLIAFPDTYCTIAGLTLALITIFLTRLRSREPRRKRLV